MRLETLLPLGKVDPGLRAPEVPFDIATVADNARLLEEIGYDGLVCEETKDDPFVVLALAAQATTRLHLTTGVAIAFPRSPAVTAMTAWTLQKLSRGRFTLGLGPQVRAHIERRLGCNRRRPAPGCAGTFRPCGCSGIAGRMGRRRSSTARTTKSI